MRHQFRHATNCHDVLLLAETYTESFYATQLKITICIALNPHLKMQKLAMRFAHSLTHAHNYWLGPTLGSSNVYVLQTWDGKSVHEDEYQNA